MKNKETDKELEKEELLNTGRRLKEARDMRGYSQPDVEKVIKIGSSLISKYERGKADPGSIKLKKFARFYRVSMDWLLGFTNDPTPIIVDSSLSEESKAEIIQYMNILKKKEGR